MAVCWMRTPNGSAEVRPGGQMLNEQMVETGDMAMWPATTALDRPRSDETLEKSAAFRLRNAGQKTVPLYLGEAMERLSSVHLLPAATAPSGPAPNGSPATTIKRGAPNPVFAFWLQGWPAEFRLGVLRAIASLPKRRPKSSPR